MEQQFETGSSRLDLKNSIAARRDMRVTTVCGDSIGGSESKHRVGLGCGGRFFTRGFWRIKLFHCRSGSTAVGETLGNRPPSL